MFKFQVTTSFYIFLHYTTIGDEGTSSGILLLFAELLFCVEKYPESLYISRRTLSRTKIIIRRILLRGD